MNGKVMLYIDQHGDRWYAKSVRELHRRLGGARPSKMYVDKKDGGTVHIGYVIGTHWCNAFVPYEKKA